MINKFLLGWIDDIRIFGRREQFALRWFTIFLLVCMLFSFRQVFYMVLPPRLVSKTSIAVLFGSFVVAYYSFLRSMFSTWRWCGKCRQIHFCLLFFTLIGFFVGIVNNYSNYISIQNILNQAFYSLAIGYLILFGNRRIIIAKIIPILLIVFYVNAIVMFSVQNVNVVSFNDAGIEEAIDEYRNTTMLSYQFKGLLGMSPFLFLVGLFKKRMKGVARVLCLLTPIIHTYFSVYLFKFRSSLMLFGMVFAFAAIYAFKTFSMKRILIVAVMVLAGIMFFFGRSAVAVRERMAAANDVHRSENWYKVFLGERMPEMELMFSSFTPVQHFIGKGFNCSYDASDRFGEKGLKWTTVHVGFLQPYLYGGVLFCLFHFMLYFLAILRKLNSGELSDGTMIACKVYVASTFVQRLVTPMQWGLYTMGSTLLLYLCIGVLLARCDMDGYQPWDENDERFIS